MTAWFIYIVDIFHWGCCKLSSLCCCLNITLIHSFTYLNVISSFIYVHVYFSHWSVICALYCHSFTLVLLLVPCQRLLYTALLFIKNNLDTCITLTYLLNDNIYSVIIYAALDIVAKASNINTDCTVYWTCMHECCLELQRKLEKKQRCYCYSLVVCVWVREWDRERERTRTRKLYLTRTVV